MNGIPYLSSWKLELQWQYRYKQLKNKHRFVNLWHGSLLDKILTNPTSASLLFNGKRWRAQNTNDESRTHLDEFQVSLTNDESRTHLDEFQVSLTNDESRTHLDKFQVSPTNDESRTHLDEFQVSLTNDESRTHLDEFQVSLLWPKQRWLIHTITAEIRKGLLTVFTLYPSSVSVTIRFMFAFIFPLIIFTFVFTTFILSSCMNLWWLDV